MTHPDAPAHSGALEGALPLLVVALGGATGALLRWGLGEAVDPGTALPWVTFAINVAGCLALAAMTGVGAIRRSPVRTLFLGPGVLGGFTTVSSWAEETRSLAADGDVALAGLYLTGTLAACLAAAAAGRRLARTPR
ncbi:CrcB family protein [Nocardioides sp.]|uniref:fluoride efflux transporter FluC n=1 Tax=Nocardioides sp. TaxID=35761 RepID=UPI00286D8160|nr:CrcB family protein [Nocardioides sp.]